MVESGAQVTGNVSDDFGDRRILDRDIEFDLVKKMIGICRVWFNDLSKGILSEEGFGFPMQVIEMFISPSNLAARAVEWSRHFPDCTNLKPLFEWGSEQLRKTPKERPSPSHPRACQSRQAQWWKEDETGGHWSSEPLPRIPKTVLFLEQYRLGRTLLSRLEILRSLVLRMRVLFASPVEWIQELRGELAGQSDHIWPHACSADMREVLEAAPGADRLDYKIAEEMWRRGAKWAYHNTDKLFSIPKHPAPISS
jgi:hypothetical protein